ncbi:MAG: sulfotransferase [Pseudomonadota bacterium]
MTHVFLIGSGRSGTSFIQRIFDAHRDTFCLHEPDIRLRTNDPSYYPDPDIFAQKSDIVRGYVDKLKAHHILRAVQKRPAFSKSYREPLAHTLREALISAMIAAEQTIGKFVSVGDWSVPDMVQTPPAHIVMKSVSMVGRIPIIADACAHMKVVHIMRHPCAVAASRQRGIALGKMPRIHIFDDQLDLPMAREHSLTRAKVDAMDDWERAAWQWVIVNDFAMTHSEGRANVRPLLYDKLCDDVFGESAALLEWCGMALDPQVEDYLKTVMATQKDSNRYHGLIRNPSIAANKWRDTVAKDDAAKVMDIVTLSKAGGCFAEWDRER